MRSRKKSAIVKASKDFLVSLPRRDEMITVPVIVTIIHDDKYGADADGMRGEPLTFVEDIEIRIPEKDDGGETLTADERDQVIGEIKMMVRDEFQKMYDDETRWD